LNGDIVTENLLEACVTSPKKQHFALAGLGIASILLSIVALSARPQVTKPKPVQASKSAVAVAILTSPGASCKISVAGSKDPADVMLEWADEDGYVRFYATRATKAGDVQGLVLSCTDPGGKKATYAADLRSDATFTPHSRDLSKVPGRDRPPLQSDSLKYTQAELLRSGYGLRPDPARSPDLFATWLASAKRPARVLYGHRAGSPSTPDAGVHTNIDPSWVGAILSGASSLSGKPKYAVASAAFKVPSVVICGDMTGDTESAIWTGLDGNAGQQLIQTGISIGTRCTMGTSYFHSFSEYIGGAPAGSSNLLAVRPEAGDTIFAAAWYCDDAGNPSTTKHNGCTELIDIPPPSDIWRLVQIGVCFPGDLSTQACTTGPLKTYPSYGQQAEFVMELQNPDKLPPGQKAWTDFIGTVTIYGIAQLSDGNNTDISTDPYVSKMVDFTNGPTTVAVSLGSAVEVSFNAGPGPAPGPPKAACTVTYQCNESFTVSCKGRDVSLNVNGAVSGHKAGGVQTLQAVGMGLENSVTACTWYDLASTCTPVPVTWKQPEGCPKTQNCTPGEVWCAKLGKCVSPQDFQTLCVLKKPGSVTPPQGPQ
jgi:hypothetical protein